MLAERNSEQRFRAGINADGAHLDDLQDGVGARVGDAHQRVALRAEPRGHAQRLRLVQVAGDHPYGAGRAAAHAAGPRQQQPLLLRLVQHVPASIDERRRIWVLQRKSKHIESPRSNPSDSQVITYDTHKQRGRRRKILENTVYQTRL